MAAEYFPQLSFRKRDAGPDPTGRELYAPHRDYSVDLPRVLRILQSALEQDYWPELVPMVDQLTEGKGWEEIEKAHDAVHKFLSICCEDSQETFDDVFARSGLSDVRSAGRFGYLAMFGVVMLGRLFLSLRDITLNNQSPPANVVKYLETGVMDARRAFNNIHRQEELQQDFYRVLRSLRSQGVGFPEMQEWLLDVQFGRASQT